MRVRVWRFHDGMILHLLHYESTQAKSFLSTIQAKDDTSAPFYRRTMFTFFLLQASAVP